MSMTGNIDYYLRNLRIMDIVNCAAKRQLQDRINRQWTRRMINLARQVFSEPYKPNKIRVMP